MKISIDAMNYLSEYSNKNLQQLLELISKNKNDELSINYVEDGKLTNDKIVALDQLLSIVGSDYTLSANKYSRLFFLENDQEQILAAILFELGNVITLVTNSEYKNLGYATILFALVAFSYNQEIKIKVAHNAKGFYEKLGAEEFDHNNYFLDVKKNNDKLLNLIASKLFDPYDLDDLTIDSQLKNFNSKEIKNFYQDEQDFITPQKLFEPVEYLQLSEPKINFCSFEMLEEVKHQKTYEFKNQDIFSTPIKHFKKLSLEEQMNSRGKVTHESKIRDSNNFYVKNDNRSSKNKFFITPKNKSGLDKKENLFGLQK